MSTTEELIVKCQAGDSQAREEIVSQNIGLIWSVVKRFTGRGTEAEDLFQLGCLGFLKAVDGFDLQFGTQFSTYAVPKISGEIRRFLRDDGTVKVSRSLKERAFTIHVVVSTLTTQLGGEPSLSQIAEATGLSSEEITEALCATAATESISAQFGEDGFSLEQILTDVGAEERIMEKMALRQAISRLPEREALAIKLRYYHGLTQERTAKVMQVSQVQVSRIEKKAISALRQMLG